MKIMKRITSILLIVLFVFGLSCFSMVSADVTAANSKLITDSPKAFYAYGFEYIDSGESPPFHRLQNLMEFKFTAGQNVHRQYTVEFTEDSSYGPAVHILDMDLTYDQASLGFGLPFITGSFNYHWEHNDQMTEYTGTVEGELIEIATDILGFDSDYVYTNAIALYLDVNGDAWDWTIYLEVPGEEEYYHGSGYIADEYDHLHESSPHVPSPSTQADVAAGVGISTVGIAVANALTKTSVFGSASFNTALNPSVAATAPSAPAPQPSPTSSGGFFGAIWDFFKNLFENLRDMLTDEGRSYASGRVSDFLEDVEIDNSGDDN